MGKYLSKYQTKEEYNNNKDNHTKPHVSFIVKPIKQMIYIIRPKSYISQYFTIVALEDGLTANLSTNACEYRIDKGSWNTLSPGTNTPSINTGQKISFKITNPNISSSSGIGTFTVNKAFNAEGNIMSLLYGDDFIGQNNLSGKNYAFYNLFYNCNTLTDASNLILPATTLASWCYYYMFCGCTSLTTAPELPATTLANYCYQYMFYRCTSLTTAPELPATTLANYCYSSMFSGCTNLTTAPELPATTLANYCYQYMFRGCTSLTTAPELPTTTLASGCYQYMFRECTSLTSVPSLPATTLADYCYSSMFRGCTGLTSAPELPATTLANYCYYRMFYGCSKLNYIKMLATDISAGNCLSGWVDGVSSTGTFIKHPDMTALSTGTSGIPEGWTVEDYVENESKNLITFYINNTEYQAEEGMTWADYYVSDMNQGIINTGTNLSKDQIYNSLDSIVYVGVLGTLLYNNVNVIFGDYIQKEGNYRSSFDDSSFGGQ